MVSCPALLFCSCILKNLLKIILIGFNMFLDIDVLNRLEDNDELFL